MFPQNISCRFYFFSSALKTIDYAGKQPKSFNCEGEEYPYPEYLAMKIRELREEIEENATLMARINDCLEAMRENPENVTEG